MSIGPRHAEEGEIRIIIPFLGNSPCLQSLSSFRILTDRHGGSSFEPFLGLLGVGTVAFSVSEDCVSGGRKIT
jgi:hypothetical protein